MVSEKVKIEEIDSRSHSHTMLKRKQKKDTQFVIVLHPLCKRHLEVLKVYQKILKVPHLRSRQIYESYCREK